MTGRPVPGPPMPPHRPQPEQQQPRSMPGAPRGSRGHDARFELRIHPDFEKDLQRLVAYSGGDRRSKEYRLVDRALHMVKGLRQGYPPTHTLEYLSDYPDLSDCETTYVGIEKDEKPSHRLVWRELPPSRPGTLPVREVIALGERQYGAAYHIAGARLGRPRGVTLEELENAPEPVAQATQAPREPEAGTARTAAPEKRTTRPRPVDVHPELREDTSRDEGHQGHGDGYER